MSASPPSAATTLKQGLLLLQRGQAEAALGPLTVAAAALPDSAQAQVAQAVALKALGRAAEARDGLIAADRRKPGQVAVLGTLGTVYQDLGDAAAADRSFRRLLALAPGQSGALNNLAVTRNHAGDRDAAIRLWEAAIAAAPADLSARLNLLSVLAQSERHAAVIDQVDAILAVRPGQVLPRLFQTRALAALGRGEAAERAARRALLIEPGAADLWFERGIAAMERPDAAGTAIGSFRRCLAADPGRARAHYNLGIVHQRASDFEPAIGCYRAALRADPTLARARSSLGQVLVTHRRYNAALPVLERVVREDPKDWGAMVALAGVLRRRGEAARAEDLLRTVLAVRPRDIGALLELSYVLMNGDRPDEALTAVLDAAAAQPLRSEVQRRLGMLYLARGAFDLAERHFGNCLALAPDATEACCHHYHCRWERHLTGGTGPEPIDMTRMVRSARVPAPPGHASTEAFNSAVIAFAESHPSLQWEPGDKTTREGRQTAPTLLFGQEAGVPAEIRQAILTRLERYLEELDPEDADWLRLIRPGELRINLWCVFLEPGGHQLTHNHPAGWISGVYYLDIPPSVRDDTGTAGCIEFGRPWIEEYPNADKHPALVVKPEAGMMVLFPSGLYHRTFPFTEGRRICLAFDLVDRKLEFHD